MQINEIENLSFDELKRDRAALIEAAEQLEMSELARRYVQARTDAKQRDEKLAEQGRTIQTLNDAMEKQTGEVGQLTGDRDRLSEANAVLAGKSAGLNASIGLFKERCKQLQLQAEKYAGAITSISKTALDAINASAIEAASE